MNKYYGWFGRDGLFYLSDEYIEDNPLEAFYIGEVEAENKETAEFLCKQLLKERFKNKGF
jgi:hypothetical protein